MLFEFKGHKLSNSLNVFNYYKSITGRSLEGDIRGLQKLDTVMNKPDATEEEIDRVQKGMPADITETVQYIYYAMRCAAEKKELDLSAVIDEVDISDLADGSLQEVIMKLVEVKKKAVVQAERRGFLSRKK
ncbi:MAG: hypothetical protein WC125_12850 [Bacteroidales bacterium]